MTADSRIPAKLLVLIALLQGLALLALHQSIEFEFWPHDSPQWLFCFYSMAFVGPVMLLLALETDKMRTIALWVLAFTLLCGALGYYIGNQAIPLNHIGPEPLLFAFVATLAIATFKALMYVQHFASGQPLSYSQLFRWSWRNFLTLGLALVFTGGFWAILMLWAGLFKAIDVDFFEDLFTERWFYYPALALANGFGVIIFRRQSRIIDTITRLQQALMKFLLVVLVLVSIIFMAALPFTGLEPLWKSGGSGLILWMQAVMLFFVNAVYQDDPDARPYSPWLHRFIYLGVALLPVYSVISFYGLSLRVDQYGWSLSRCWAVLIWGLLAAFATGYLWGIVKQRDNWLNQLSWVNVRMGLVVLAAMLIINSPLVDFRKISVNSQLARLQSGDVDVKDFDFNYFRRHLAKPGYVALKALKKDLADTNPEVVVRINSLYRDRKVQEAGITRDELVNAIKVIEGDMPNNLADEIYAMLSKNSWRMNDVRGYYLLPVDLDKNTVLDYLFVAQHEHRVIMTLFYYENNQWQHVDMTASGDYRTKADKIIAALEQGEIEMVSPRWQQLNIGEYQLQVR